MAPSLVKVSFTWEEMYKNQEKWQVEVGGNPDQYTHRDFIRAKFADKGWKVIKPLELRYFYGRKGVVVEGVPGIGIESM